MTNASSPLALRRVRTWLRLLRVTRSTENHLREFLRVNHETTLPRFDVVAALVRNEKPMKMSDLSQNLLVSNGNATVVVERLEKEGVVQRVPSDEDRRVVFVALTDAGRSWFDGIAVSQNAEIDKLFSNLGHAELDAFRDLIRLLEDTENAKNG